MKKVIKTSDGLKVKIGMPLFYYYGRTKGVVVSLDDSIDALKMDNGDLLYLDYDFFAKKSNRKFADEEFVVDKEFISKQIKELDTTPYSPLGDTSQFKRCSEKERQERFKNL